MDYYTEIFDKQPLTDYSYVNISGGYIKVLSWYQNGIYYTDMTNYGAGTGNFVSGSAGFSPTFYSFALSGTGNAPFFAIQTGQLINIYQSATTANSLATFTGFYPQLFSNWTFNSGSGLSCFYLKPTGICFRSSIDNWSNEINTYSGGTNQIQDILILNPPYNQFLGVFGFDENMLPFILTNSINVTGFINVYMVTGYMTNQLFFWDVNTFSGLPSGMISQISQTQLFLQSGFFNITMALDVNTFSGLESGTITIIPPQIYLQSGFFDQN